MNATTPFDAYHQWLGISPKDQPPNHYRLLGIEVFETSLDVISNAADRQMAHLRSFQSGRHALESQKLLNEVAMARVCLLNLRSKSAYDAQLYDRLRSDQEARAPEPLDSIVIQEIPMSTSVPKLNKPKPSAAFTRKLWAIRILMGLVVLAVPPLLVGGLSKLLDSDARKFEKILAENRREDEAARAPTPKPQPKPKPKPEPRKEVPLAPVLTMPAPQVIPVATSQPVVPPAPLYVLPVTKDPPRPKPVPVSKPVPAPKPAPVIVPGPTPETISPLAMPVDDKQKILGQWEVKTKPNPMGVSWAGVYTFYASGRVESLAAGRLAEGVWAVQGNAIEVKWQKVRSAIERFRLPISDTVDVDSNVFKTGMTAVRK